MDCSAMQRHQETMASQSLDSMFMCTKSENSQQLQQEKKPKPPADEQALKCPRCDSPNTKFCYYNNYSLTQPRYFCKSCRRYWTKGGTLRNVPVGGGCRKNRRSSLSSRNTTPEHLQVPSFIATPTSSTYDHHTLGLSHRNNLSIFGNHGNSHFDLFGNPSGNNFLETLKSGLIENNPLLYYGLGASGNLGNVENGGGESVNLSHEDGHEIYMQYSNNHSNHQEIMSNPSSGSSTPTMKEELGGNRILWGLPWQLNGEGHYINGGNNETDIAGESWNTAIVGTTWNNLINSPLI